MIGGVNEKKAELRSTREAISTEHRSHTLLNDNTSFMVTEAYKAIRTNIIFTLSGVKHSCKKIILTSASPGEGKTTTCINLAIAFSQIGARVLVIGADLRKPRLYRHLQIERKNGLSDLLGGLIGIEDAIKHCEKYGIDCITAGQIPPNPVELLSSNRMGEVMEQLSEVYDYIFIDTPPIMLVTDATAMSKYVDGVIVVVRQNYTIHETLERTRSSLCFAEAKILGYILNDVDNLKNRYTSYKKYGYSKRGGYGYGGKSYGYGYGYGYGYSNSISYGQKPEMQQQSTSTEANYIGYDNSYTAQTHDDVVQQQSEEEEKKIKRKSKKA